MEPNHPTRPKVAVLSRPDPMRGALSGSAGTPSAGSAPAKAPLPRRGRDTKGQFTEPVAIRLPLPVRPPPAATGLALARSLETRWDWYREQLRRCQREFSDDAVHELRVATRRLLAQFTLLGCIVPTADLEKARRLLKRRVAALGDLRDVQVQRLFVQNQTGRFPELRSLGAWLRRRERRLAKSATAEVKRCKTRKLGKWMAALSADLTAGAAEPRAQHRLTTAVWRATTQAFGEACERRQAIDIADLRTVHQTRVAFKRFRYMVEALSPSLTGLSKRQLRVLAYYQRKMGIIQDLVVMQACLARFIGQSNKRQRRLRPFSRYLQQRRARALRSFLKSADRIHGFWPPAGHAAPDHAVSTRSAA
jgi:CHAD domain-containing protein